MRQTVAKRLRKEAVYESNANPEIAVRLYKEKKLAHGKPVVNPIFKQTRRQQRLVQN